MKSDLMAANSISVQLVDDHSIARSGCRRLLEENHNISVCVESDSAEAAWKDYMDHKPDVIIMDLSMPGMGGVEGIKRILSRDPDARILVLTMHGDEVASRVIQLGAKGYINKSTASVNLVKAVQAIMQGKTFIDVQSDDQSATGYAKAKSNPFDALSKREFEIVMLMLAEKTGGKIADILCLSPKTVHTHKNHIFSKLRVSSMVGLTCLAIAHKLLEKPL